jgi:hypothetical protein
MPKNKVTLSAISELPKNKIVVTLDPVEKKKLSPISISSNSSKNKVIIKTKPGTNGNQLKINQDMAIV